MPVPESSLPTIWVIVGLFGPSESFFPRRVFCAPYGETNEQRPALLQWDGKVMHNPGQYWEYCAYSPNMLLTYRNLRTTAHPANMWWFFRVPPYVYDRGQLIDNQLSEWLYALRDVRR